MFTQSQVSPSISPMRREQENARFIASERVSSSQALIALKRISAVQISLGICSSFGRDACSTGFFVISSQRTAWLNAFLSSLWISRTVCGVRYSFLGLAYLFVTDLTLRSSR